MENRKSKPFASSLFILLSLALIIVMLSFGLHCFYSYFYPMAYSSEIKSYSEKYNIESALIASVANAESGFDEKSISSKGAIGITQLMPSTAEWLSKRLGEEYQQEKLLDGEYNLNLGAYYLSYLLEMFQDTKNALCAYNAGPNTVKEWLKNQQYSSDGKSLDEIPFAETKNYLNRVMKNYSYYSKRYS